MSLFNTVSVIALIGASAPALAQTEAPVADAAAATGTSVPDIVDDASTGDIVVTAQRRSESVQKTPLAIAAITGATLRTASLSDITQLSSRIPNVTINTVLGTVRVTIRGIGSVSNQPNAESQIAYHVDGVYIGRPEATSDGFFDVERIEVVRGPQGALYGRNATAGAINVVTRDPTDTFSGYGEATFGTYELAQFEGGVGGPIAEGVSARISGQSIDRGGYGKNGVGDDLDSQHTKAIRGKLKLQPTDSFTTVFSANYFRERDSSGGAKYVGPGDLPGGFNHAFAIGGVPANDRYFDTNGDSPTRLSKDNWGVSAITNWNVMDAMTLTSITAYMKTKFFQTDDYDMTKATLAFYSSGANSKQFSQELRAGGTIGRFNYVVGAYYFRNDLFFRAGNVRNRQNFDPTLSPQLLKSYYSYGGLKTDAYAAFGQIGFEFTDKLGIDVGGRYSVEQKHRYADAVGNIQPPSLPYPTPTTSAGYAILLNPANFYNPLLGQFDPANLPPVTQAPEARATFKKFTPKITLRFKPTPDIMAYATYSEGFRSGGYALGSGGNPFKPEILKDYEAGIKADLFDHALRTNLSVFHYKYSNLQVQRNNPSGGANIVESAGSAEVNGGELSVTLFPRKDFQANVDIGYTDSQYKNYTSVDSSRAALGILNLAGNQLAQAPKWNVSGGIQNSWHSAIGTITLRGEARYSSKIYFTAFNTDAYSQKAFAMFDAFLNYESPTSGLYGGVFVKNIGNQRVWSAMNAYPVSVGAYIGGTSYPPRTAGARIGYKF